jgi:hypothetical protein
MHIDIYDRNGLAAAVRYFDGDHGWLLFVSQSHAPKREVDDRALAIGSVAIENIFV